MRCAHCGEDSQRVAQLYDALRQEWNTRILPDLDYEDAETGRWAWLDHPWFELLSLTESDCLKTLESAP